MVSRMGLDTFEIGKEDIEEAGNSNLLFLVDI